ncbi:MAG: hypothetical protein JW873_02630 [Candidatus Saganbacteria bacterium]|nr:hypothetical protein [Candidatus Saganbacteria bacterium]
MNSRDVVVRIIQPLEQPQPPKRKTDTGPALQPENNLFHLIINGLTLSAICLLALFIGVSYFHLGVSFNDIAVLVGVPVTLGIVAGYAVL